MTLSDLLLHPTAQSSLQAMAAVPPHGVLLTGLDSVGKYTAALAWAATINPHIAARSIEPDEKGTISIDTIRTLYRESRGKRDDTQAIIIRDADAMTTEAQNAFLKLLEEPPKGVTFILTTARHQDLLPTIQSRVQQIELHPLPNAALRAHALARQPHISNQDLAQMLFVAAGRPGILTAMLNDATVLEANRSHMQLAKSLLSDPPHKRYLAITKLAADRTTCQKTLEAMMAMTSAQLRRPQTPVTTRHWATIANLLQQTLQAISQNGNLKAQLLVLFSRY